MSRLDARRGGLVVELARPDDDAEIRRLLRDTPFGDRVRVSFEREPDASIAAAMEGDPHHTLIARRREGGELLGMGSRAVRPVWVDGRPGRLGYLGQFRRARGAGRAMRWLGEAYRELLATHRPGELPFDLTSIVVDNVPARRLLERGGHGIPAYRPLGGFVTLVLSVPRRPARPTARIERGSAAAMPEVVDCLGRNLSRLQFAPRWTEADLFSEQRTPGLTPEDFLLLREGPRVTGCLALWDQRRFKQIVVRGYARQLARWRPLLNGVRRLGRRPALPPPGRQLALAYLSHVAVDGNDAGALIALVNAALPRASASGLDYLALGLAAAHPLLGPLRDAVEAYEYRSVLYLVGDPRLTESASGTRPLHVEVATL